MNHRMLARSQGGFTTCLVLRADAGGQLIAASAGHLAPYRNGEELNIDGGLPLGLDANASYPESSFEFPAAVQLTLLTDGVVEARAKDGQLFGFERSRAISDQSAQKIAEAAQSFGQEDDITVLTLSRVAVALSI
jgi:serine phosphatase RsbU (regulator of sigma subunit)